jgi:protein-disulfide isomerase
VTINSNQPRRSARQERLARRTAARRGEVQKPSKRRSSPSLLWWTGGAVLIAVAVIAAAVWFSGGKNNTVPANNNSPFPPQSTIAANVPTDALTLGNPAATVTLDIWGDFQCPVCRDFTDNVEPTLITNYVATGKVKLVWHDWLVIDLNHPGTHESLDAANAARCAADQNQFWAFHNWLYTNQYGEASGAFTLDRLRILGAAAGLDTAKFDTCLANGTHNAEVQAQSGKPPSGATGTPAILINGSLQTNFGLPDLSAVLDKALGITPSPSVSGGVSPSASTTSSSSASVSASSSITNVPSISPSPKAS